MDVGHWNDTYEYVGDRNEPYLEQNYTKDSLENLRVDFVLALDLSGEVLFQFAPDSNGVELSHLSPDAVQYLSQTEMAKLYLLNSEGGHGIVKSPEGWAVVGSSPILTSQSLGSSRGTLMFGRYLDPGLLREIESQLPLDLKIHDLASKSSRVKSAQRWQPDAANGIEVFAVNSTAIEAWILVQDVTQQPAFWLETDQPLESYPQALKSVRWFTIYLILAGLLATAFILAALRRLIVVRLENLSEAADRVRAGSDKTVHFPVQGKDEIAGLAGILNHMLDSLRAYAKNLQESEERHQQGQKMEAIGRLAGGVSHDLNNLLCPIQGYSELLLEAFEPDDPRHEYVEEIQGASRRASALVRQLLAFSRKQTLQIRIIGINEVINNFQKLLRRTIRENIKIEFELSERLPAIRADANQIEQVLMNLAVNAQDAMPKGGTLRITTCVTSADEALVDTNEEPLSDQYVRLSVIDDGEGMDAETRRKIFEPFFTTKEHGKGTGLGLASIYGIVKQHNGTIRVTSKLRRGSTFHVYFPVSDKQQTDPIPCATIPENLCGTETILIAEDDVLVRDLAVRVLESYGYRIIAVGDSKEAILWLKSQDAPLDLILTDMVMPGLNGNELSRLIRCRYPDIRILFMSGYSHDILDMYGIGEEDFQFLPKPFTSKELAGKVRNVLDHSETGSLEKP